MQDTIGKHILVDLVGASHLAQTDLVLDMMHEAAAAAGATVLLSHIHPFDTNGGLSGVLVLAESHMSIHTWPEFDFAAMDIFMCGSAQPKLCLPVIERCLRPERLILTEVSRGQSLEPLPLAQARRA
jgi:S-adenosylmethionine decarboxylase